MACKIALYNGADAIYLGGKIFGPALVDNFSPKRNCWGSGSLPISCGEGVWRDGEYFAYTEDLTELPAHACKFLAEPRWMPAGF